MAESDQFIRFLAAWALVHETADEGWKAAVARGEEAEPGSMSAGPEPFVDGLSALVAAEKERLKTQLADGSVSTTRGADVTAALEEVRFEVAEVRARLESMQSALDTVLARLPASPDSR